MPRICVNGPINPVIQVGGGGRAETSSAALSSGDADEQGGGCGAFFRTLGDPGDYGEPEP
jgi:hypothetical protein